METSYKSSAEPIYRSLKYSLFPSISNLHAANLLLKMRRFTRSSARSQPATSDKPLPPNPVDLKIAHHHGTSVALEATTERLEASKKAPISSPEERIHELTKEGGQQRLEIRYHLQMQDATRDLYEDCKFVAERLERAIAKFSSVQEEVEADWYQAMEGVQTV